MYVYGSKSNNIAINVISVYHGFGAAGCEYDVIVVNLPRHCQHLFLDFAFSERDKKGK